MASIYKTVAAVAVMIGLAGIVYYVLSVTGDTVALLG
jgi:hypothetical protein